MAGMRKANPAGSTNSFRGDVLRVLGVLKVATADQIQRIGAPHLSFRHTDKEIPSKQKQARTASHTGALSDMRKHALAENGGSTEAGERLRNLTAKGLEAASYELRRPVTEMGSTARGAGSSGASHPMAVNETVIAMLRPKPNLARLAEDPPAVRAAAQAAVDAPDGIGTIASYWTEIPLPATGTWNAPGKGGAQADVVLTAPQDGVPLLFIEVDNCHETAEELADKLEKYARFFRREMKDTDGRERPMWRTRWTAPASWSGDRTHPPVLLVFNRIGDRNPNRTVPRLTELTRHLWERERQRGGHHVYDGRIPIIATGLQNLREHGPAGAPRSSASAATACNPCWRRSATPAARRPTPGNGKRPGPVSRSTRHSCGRKPSRRKLSVWPAAPPVPPAGRSSPTTGGPEGRAQVAPDAVRRVRGPSHRGRAPGRAGRARAPGTSRGPGGAEGRRLALLTRASRR
ncbi:replication-relaxation family protein [Streptomyces sp. NBC_00829]|uniref:replication-relaxation family protein n=1 Tax=Streptomyces sp. NBC_00829 TaxID=2903679 RepID=UPI00386D84BB|nr:replication-relaxation family protein [Streptomyces sp. NBC_00829]